MKKNKRKSHLLRNCLLGSLCILMVVLIIFSVRMITRLVKAEKLANAGNEDSVADAWINHGKIVTTKAPTATPIPTPTEIPLIPAAFSKDYPHLTENKEEFSGYRRISCGLRYPVYENAGASQAVREYAESLLAEMQAVYEEQSGTDGTLLIDYEDGSIQALHSVLFHCLFTQDDGTIETTKMFVYNEKKEKAVDAENLFADRAYVDLSVMIAEQTGKEPLPGTRETFSSYLLTADGIRFTFDDGTGEQTALIPYIRLHTYMTTTTNGLETADMIRELDPEKPMIALTFDDGPTWVDDRTMRVLKALEENNSRGTFFLLGDSVVNKAKPEILKALGESGNEIASHTYSHSDDTLKNFTLERLTKEIEDTRQAIFEGTGVYPTFIRPPYGAYNDRVKKNSYAPLITWNVDSDDWKLREKDAIVKHVLEEAGDGKIVLMHDIHEFTVAAAEEIIPELVKRGYQIVSVRELFYYKGIELKNGEVYNSAR